MHSKSRKKVNKSQPQSPLKSKCRKNISLSKSINQLSISFYDSSTLRKNKQVILDNYPLDFSLAIECNNHCNADPNINGSSSKKIKQPINNGNNNTLKE